MNKFTLDVDRLYSFLLDNDKFQFKNLKKYFDETYIHEEYIEEENFEKEKNFCSPNKNKNSFQNKIYESLVNDINILNIEKENINSQDFEENNILSII